VGLSNVSLGELGQGQQVIETATVQNRFNLIEQGDDDVLRACEAAGIGFIPFAPIAMGGLAASSGALASVAARHGATHAQLALAWLLERSPIVLPIPGTGSLEHLRDNLKAALIELSESDLRTLERDAVSQLAPPS
jgi:pyridoxine 4-dehydrogenase